VGAGSQNAALSASVPDPEWPVVDFTN